MKFLLVVRDRLTSDQIKVGLQQFADFSVTCGLGYAAINEARDHHYDCIFLEIDPEDGDGLRLLQHLRSFDRATEVVVVTSERNARDMQAEKTRMNIAGFLATPLDVKEFFRMIGRFRARRRDAEAAKATATARRG